MRERFSGSMVAVAIAAIAVSAAVSVPASRTSAQAPAASGTAPKTPWGEPDLQGIWTDEFDTALQRPAEYASQEFFTQAQREEIDKQRRAHFGSDPRQAARQRDRRRRRLQHGVLDREACRRAHIIDRRSAQWPDSAADAGGAAGCCGRPGISPRPAAIDGRVQEQGSGMCRRQLRSDALASICGNSAALSCGQLRALQSRRWSGRRRLGGPLPAQRPARLRQLVRRELSPDRADTGRHRDVLRL